MGLFGSFFGKKTPRPGANPIHETLFGDLPLEKFPPDDTGVTLFPWSAFISARRHLATGDRQSAINDWQQVIQKPGLGSRCYLQAWHFLRSQSQQPPADIAKKVMGVVLEMNVPGGLDVLAAYSDHSARYYNYSGAGIVWEHPDDSLDSPIDELLAAAKIIVDKIGPWDKPRLAAPPAPQARLNFLTPGGLCFGQGRADDLANDAMASPVLDTGTALLQALIAKTQKSPAV